MGGTGVLESVLRSRSYTPQHRSPKHADTSSPGHYRPDIQGLRAIAVAAVVVFHLWPNILTGGFVGVDVFFVISGFLITGHLFREVQSSGTVRLLRFWSRRIARLLPASLLVLLVVAVATVLVVPKTLWPSFFGQIRASAMYYQNWKLANDSVDYWATDSQATAVQHYWSLSVEEQFYLVWPILLVVGLLVAKRFLPKLQSRATFSLILTGIFVGSLIFSVIETASRQQVAYFSSFTRVWEFAAGGLVALTGVYLPRNFMSSRTPAVLAWTGIGLIVASAAVYSGQTAFPGITAAVPVLGTILLLCFGNSSSSLSPRELLSSRVSVWIGGISYAIYLWHWPLIVLVPFATGRELTIPAKLLIVAMTLLLAHFSTNYYETPLRRSKFFKSPTHAITFALVGALFFGGLGWFVNWQLQREVARAEAQIAAQREQEWSTAKSSCDGPGALNPANGCQSPMGSGEYLVAPDIVSLRSYSAYGGCQQEPGHSKVRSCEIGAPEPEAKKKMILVGDSHATQWAAAFDKVGQKDRWLIESITKGNCPLSYMQTIREASEPSDAAQECNTWVDGTMTKILASEAETVVITTRESSYSWTPRADMPQYADPVDGYAATFEAIANSGKKVLVINDNPGLPQVAPKCLADNPSEPGVCAAERASAVSSGLMTQAVQQLNRSDITVLNLDDQFCDSALCYPVIGDIIVYIDTDHITPEYADALMPWVAPHIVD